MKALDLYCGAGGASRGLADAGFDVIGVDIKRRKNYPFAFIEGDALEVSTAGFDLIWASPPCQAYTQAAASQRNAGKVYPDLMAATRARLIESGTPYIIENTPGAPIRVDVILCGSMFGLKLIRHRWFECSFPVFCLANCQHSIDYIDVTGTGGRRINGRHDGKGGDSKKPRSLNEAREAMGIDWMNRNELSQAIPPAYSKWLAQRFLETLPKPKESDLFG